ncbi:MAG: metal-dependent hydrolase [Thermoflexales bacterium]|nr:metal-dependent hydrolase [Thermoflexales bacterium]
MKGISHFLAGIAAASFVPGVVESAAQGSYLILLGGIFGLLPDTLDFKFARYFDRAEAVDPDPANLDPQALADQIAALIDRAASERREIRAQLHTIKLGPDRWRQYTVRFDSAHNEVAVRIGPVVNTSQMVVAQVAPTPTARAKVNTPLNYTYDGDINVDIFGGPSFAFVPKASGVEIQFLPWHRAWSHSLTLAVMLGVIIGLVFNSLQAGLVVAAGMAAHVVEDQLGFLGSNLFWPITTERSSGLKLIHSGDAIPNFLAVWIALQLIFFNLDRFSAAPQHRAVMLEPVSFFALAVGAPTLTLAAIYLWQKRRTRLQLAAARQADILSESQETEV